MRKSELAGKPAIVIEPIDFCDHADDFLLEAAAAFVVIDEPVDGCVEGALRSRLPSIDRFREPGTLVSYLGLDLSVRQSGPGLRIIV